MIQNTLEQYERDPFTTVSSRSNTKEFDSSRSSIASAKQPDHYGPYLPLAEPNRQAMLSHSIPDDDCFQPSPTDLLRSSEVQPLTSNYLRSLLRCLLMVKCDPEELLDETDRNNLSAGDYIVTTIRNGVRHTFLTQLGYQLATSE